jgi:hypothetical protein
MKCCKCGDAKLEKAQQNYDAVMKEYRKARQETKEAWGKVVDGVAYLDREKIKEKALVAEEREANCHKAIKPVSFALTDAKEGSDVTDRDILTINMVENALARQTMAMQLGFKLPLCQECYMGYVVHTLENGPFKAKELLTWLGKEPTQRPVLVKS